MSNLTAANPKTLGYFFISFAILMGLVILPGAKDSASPVLYVFIFGGLFVGVFATLGVGLLTGRVKLHKW